MMKFVFGILFVLAFYEEVRGDTVCHNCTMNTKDDSTSVICTSTSNLTSIPQCFPTNITVLFLEGGNIHELQDDAFKMYTNLVYLSLSNNSIHTVGANAFRKLTNLSYLDLSSNNIEKLDNDTFTPIAELTILYFTRPAA